MYNKAMDESVTTAAIDSGAPEITKRDFLKVSAAGGLTITLLLANLYKFFGPGDRSLSNFK